MPKTAPLATRAVNEVDKLLLSPDSRERALSLGVNWTLILLPAQLLLHEGLLGIQQLLANLPDRDVSKPIDRLRSTSDRDRGTRLF